MAEEQPGNGGQGEQGGADGGRPEAPVSWDAWLRQQPETVRTLADAHVSGLKNALAGEREQRKTLAKELKDALAKAEKGSELETALTAMASRAETAERRAVFFEMAAAIGFTDASGDTVTYTWTSQAFVTGYNLSAQATGKITSGPKVRLSGLPGRAVS